MSLKGLLGAILAGMAYKTAVPLVVSPKITERRKSGDSEIIREYRSHSIIGGGVRAGLSYLLLKGASWGLEDEASGAVRQVTGGLIDATQKIKEEYRRGR